MIVFLFVFNIFVRIREDVETGVAISVTFARVNQVAFLYGFFHVNSLAVVDASFDIDGRSVAIHRAFVPVVAVLPRVVGHVIFVILGNASFGSAVESTGVVFVTFEKVTGVAERFAGAQTFLLLRQTAHLYQLSGFAFVPGSTAFQRFALFGATGALGRRGDRVADQGE